MLGALGLSPQPLTAPQMANAMGVSRQGAQKQLNMLLNEGLVEKRPNPHHKRSPLFELAADGQARFEQINRAWNQHARRVERAFSQEELATTLQILNHIHELHQSPEQGADL